MSTSKSSGLRTIVLSSFSLSIIVDSLVVPNRLPVATAGDGAEPGSPVLQRDGIACGPAGKQHPDQLAAIAWSLCRRRLRSRRSASACASATVKVRGGESTMMDKENEDKTIVLSPDDWDVLITHTIDDEIDSKQCAVIVNWLNTTERSIRSGLTRLENEEAL